MKIRIEIINDAKDQFENSRKIETIIVDSVNDSGTGRIVTPAVTDQLRNIFHRAVNSYFAAK